MSQRGQHQHYIGVSQRNAGPDAGCSPGPLYPCLASHFFLYYEDGIRAAVIRAVCEMHGASSFHQCAQGCECACTHCLCIYSQSASAATAMKALRKTLPPRPPPQCQCTTPVEEMAFTCEYSGCMTSASSTQFCHKPKTVLKGVYYGFLNNFTQKYSSSILVFSC